MKIQKISELVIPHKSVLLYGVSGTGKTTAMSHLKGKTLLIDIDKGSSVLHGLKRDDFFIAPVDEGLTELPKILAELEKKCDYDNIVLDTVSELEKTMLTVLGRLGKLEGQPEQSHYLKVQYKLVDYCRRLRALPANVIFLAWEQQREHIDPAGNKYTQAIPLLSGKTADTMIGLVDICGRLEISTKEETEGKRYVLLQTSHRAICKDRLNKRSYCEIEDLL